jgi:hypothetical protein
MVCDRHRPIGLHYLQPNKHDGRIFHILSIRGGLPHQCWGLSFAGSSFESSPHTIETFIIREQANLVGCLVVVGSSGWLYYFFLFLPIFYFVFILFLFSFLFSFFWSLYLYGGLAMPKPRRLRSTPALLPVSWHMPRLHIKLVPCLGHYS